MVALNPVVTASQHKPVHLPQGQQQLCQHVGFTWKQLLTACSVCFTSQHVPAGHVSAV